MHGTAKVGQKPNTIKPSATTITEIQRDTENPVEDIHCGVYRDYVYMTAAPKK